MASEFSNYKSASVFTRKRLGVSRLTSEQKAEVEAAVQRHNERQQRKTATATETTVQRIKRCLRQEVEQEITPIVKRLYRRAGSSWAGGKTFVRVQVATTPSAEGHSERAWSDNGKWSGSNAILNLSVMPGWRRHIQSIPGLEDAGGMLTTHAKQIDRDCWEASWIKQGRGFDIVSESGYIVLGSDGEFYHGKTEKSARDVIKRKLTAEQREKEKSTVAAYVKGLTVDQIVAEYGSLQIKRSDSIRSGNCEAGTDNWIEVNFPDRETATIAEVLQADSSNRVMQAVKAAIIRQVKKPQSSLAVA